MDSPPSRCTPSAATVCSVHTRCTFLPSPPRVSAGSSRSTAPRCFRCSDSDQERMAGQENTDQHDAALHAQLRLFCHLMLGSADAADRMIQQIYRCALDCDDKQENYPSERVQ